jgi:hypothetical protein
VAVRWGAVLLDQFLWINRTQTSEHTRSQNMSQDRYSLTMGFGIFSIAGKDRLL